MGARLLPTLRFSVFAGTFERQLHEGKLAVYRRLAGRALRLYQIPVHIVNAGLGVIAQRKVKDFVNSCNNGRVGNRTGNFNALFGIARHQVSRADVKAFLRAYAEA